MERAEQEGIPEPFQVFTLEGGIKAWVNGGSRYTHYMDAYEPEYWTQFAEIKPGEKRTAGDAPIPATQTGADVGSPTKKRREETV